MLLPVAAFALGSWSYADFLAVPKPPPFPARLVEFGPIEAELPLPVSPVAETATVPAIEVGVPDSRDVGASTSQPASPDSEILLYRGTDLSGIEWEHADPVALQNFLDEQNRRITARMESTNLARSQVRHGWFRRFR